VKVGDFASVQSTGAFVQLVATTYPSGTDDPNPDLPGTALVVCVPRLNGDVRWWLAVRELRPLHPLESLALTLDEPPRSEKSGDER